MPVKVYCPSCDKELNAPDDLLGKTVACPRCNERFPVGKNGGAPPAQNLYPPTGNLYPPGFESPPAKPAEPQQDDPMAKSPPVVPPPAPQSSSGAARFLGPPPVENSGPAVPVSPAAPPESPVAAPPRQNAATEPTGKPVAPATPRKPVQRKTQAAKFVTAGKTASHVQLGADGQLPQLVLKEGEKKERRGEEKQGMNPLILVAVFALSLGMSAAILFIPQPSVVESDLKKQARKEIEKYYIGEVGALEPYEVELREALQAYGKEDYNLERQKYRNVMNMLHREGLPPSGLTGRQGLSDPDAKKPNDRDLIRQLSILLR